MRWQMLKNFGKVGNIWVGMLCTNFPQTQYDIAHGQKVGIDAGSLFEGFYNPLPLRAS